MQHRLKIAQLVATAWLIVSTPSSAAAQEADVNIADEIHATILRIRSETEYLTQYTLAQEMVLLVQQAVADNGGESISDDTTDEIASLLDTFPQWSATALGHMGPSAERAVPALVAALAKLEAEREDAWVIAGIDNDPAYVICDALERIVQEPSDRHGAACARLNKGRRAAIHAD